LALLDGESDFVATPPFEFVGIGDANEERFVDGCGHSVSTLDIYRADHSGDDGHGSSVGHAYLAHALRQVEDAGYRRVSDHSDGARWHRERV
jgi:hypothetical protein